MTTAANHKTRLDAISAVLQVMTLFSLPFNQLFHEHALDISWL